MSLAVLFLAFLHATPILLVGYVSRNESNVTITAFIMGVIAVFAGASIFTIVDLVAVFLAFQYAMTLCEKPSASPKTSVAPVVTSPVSAIKSTSLKKTDCSLDKIPIENIVDPKIRREAKSYSEIYDLLEELPGKNFSSGYLLSEDDEEPLDLEAEEIYFTEDGILAGSDDDPLEYILHLIELLGDDDLEDEDLAYLVNLFENNRLGDLGDDELAYFVAVIEGRLVEDHDDLVEIRENYDEDFEDDWQNYEIDRDDCSHARPSQLSILYADEELQIELDRLSGGRIASSSSDKPF